MCKNKIMKIEIKYTPVNGRKRALARIQIAIFKYSGRKRENHGAMPVTHLLFGAQRDTQMICMADISLGISCEAYVRAEKSFPYSQACTSWQ